jgi:hypothetical protein
VSTRSAVCKLKLPLKNHPSPDTVDAACQVAGVARGRIFFHVFLKGADPWLTRAQ